MCCSYVLLIRPKKYQEAGQARKKNPKSDLPGVFAANTRIYRSHNRGVPSARSSPANSIQPGTSHSPLHAQHGDAAARSPRQGAGALRGAAPHALLRHRGLVGQCRLTVSKPALKAPLVSVLDIKHDRLLSSVAFNCNLRHYSLARRRTRRRGHPGATSSTFFGTALHVLWGSGSLLERLYPLSDKRTGSGRAEKWTSVILRKPLAFNSFSPLNLSRFFPR